MIKPAQSYLDFAAALYRSSLDDQSLFAAKAANLPPLTLDLLDELTNCAAEVALQSPRQAWAITAAADFAAQYQEDDYLSAIAAWQLGRFANEYGRPKLAAETLDRAETLLNALHKTGQIADDWLAAVTWQRHALCWASPNLALAVDELETAVSTLEESASPLHTFAPHCRLTLAYAKLLKGNFDNLPDLLEQCLTDFGEANDALCQARTHFIRSGLLRRETPLHKAKAASLEGMKLARSINAKADIGRFQCQMGYNDWLCDGDYEAATASFQAGIQQFESLDIPGWVAQCQEGLVQIYMMTGRLTEAGQLLQSALDIYQQEAVFGQRPHAFLSAGWLDSARGNYQSSINYLKQSETGYRESGNYLMASVVKTHLGETYLKLGRFQQALQNLEQAYSHLETLNLPGRLAECGLRLVRLWTRLGDAKQALYYLQKVREHVLAADHASALLAYYLRLAEYFDDQADAEKTIEFLNDALLLAQSQRNPSVEAQCRRQLAKTYAQQRQLEQAIEQLTLAEQSVNKIGLRHEQAACLLIWGDIYRQQALPEKARSAFQKAADLSQELMPDLHWQAAASLAELAREAEDKDEALRHYRQMIDSLRLLRQGFWQPELSGSYLKRPSPSLNQAVLLCAQSGRHQETLTFIEETKAQTTARRIQAQTLFRELNLIPQKAQDLMAEIRWLQENLRTSESQQFLLFRSAEYENKYLQLREKIDIYTDYLNRSQRERIDESRVPMNSGFSAEQFRQQANKHLGNNWVALDYYQVDAQLVCLLLTPDQIIANPVPIPDSFLTAINGLNWPQTPGGRLPLPILKDAGQYLLPADIQAYLQEKTTLIIAPHRDLHRLPWAAIHINGSAYRPLVDAVTPVIVPSLHTLSLLWQREEWQRENANGLLLAVSTFQGRHPALPAVRQEVEELTPFMGIHGRTILDQEATVNALSSAMGGASTAQYDFWHIASHAFHDEHSGRLSGLALYDRDFWLDELWQLAPLPGLVTFSACGSGKSRLFEGDEHIGLTTTCLTAGANHVVGSIWNVLDTGMPGIMAEFYAQLRRPQNGTAVPVSEALAQAQRQAWKNDESWQEWAGFRCTGRP